MALFCVIQNVWRIFRGSPEFVTVFTGVSSVLSQRTSKDVGTAYQDIIPALFKDEGLEKAN